MAKIQIDIPEPLYKKLKVFKAKHDYNNLSQVVIIYIEAYQNVIDRQEQDEKAGF